MVFVILHQAITNWDLAMDKKLLLLNLLLLSLSSFGENYTPISKEYLKKTLSKEQYTCTQESGTEAPFKNAYWNNYEDGLYIDIIAGVPLFSSLDKFDSGTGWPSFTKPIDDYLVQTKIDNSLKISRIELRSKISDSHLGHVFDDGPGPDHKRFCINSAALNFIPLKDFREKGLGKYLFSFANKLKWETALLSGGCFWGMQDQFRNQKGVIYTDVGYTGGSIKKASYEDVHTGRSGHAEVVRILYDPKITTYKNILLYFFRIHDPTTLNQQGNDLGSQYRSAIFYSNDFQKKTAEEVIKRVNQSKNWGAQVVTKLEKASEYYRGEEYHQDYLVKNHGGYTCHFPRKFKF